MSRQHADDRQRHERSLELAATAVDFGLPNAEVGELQAHLATCPACARRAAAMRADARVLSRPLTLLPSPRVDAAVHAAIARPSAQPRRLLLLAAAALLVVTLIGAVAVGASRLFDRPSLPTTVLPTPTPPEAVGTPGPDASPASVGATWGTMTIPASDVGTGWIGLMEAVAVTESGFVAVGRPVCVPQNDPTMCHASVWTAAPGEGWTRAPDQPGLEVSPTFATSGPQPGMFDVASGSAGLVAIGYAFGDELGGPSIWQSHDGRTWERNPFAFGPSGEQARFSAIAASPRGYVIVGWVFGGGIGSETLGARAAAWISPDGVTWRRAADTERMDVGPCLDTGEEPSCGGMRSVAPTASGFVAVGDARVSADSTEPSHPAAWTSPDGLAWTRSDTGLEFDGRLSGVAAGGPGLVAVGTVCVPDCLSSAAGGVAAASVDGSTWTFAAVRGAAVLEEVASDGGPALALGMRESNGAPAELQLWQSEDGLAWQRVSSLPTIQDASSYPSFDIAAAPDRAVIVGWADVQDADVRRNVAYASPPPGTSDPPAPSPSPSGPAASITDPTVLLRVEIRGDASVGPTTRLTVYRDGAILYPDQDGGRLTRLTPEGVALLLAPAMGSDLFTRTGVIERDPAATNGGLAMYAIDLRRADRLVHRWTTNESRPADQAETDRIIALARRIVDHESWLPAEAWLTSPGSATRYIPSQFLLKVGVYDNLLNDQPTTELDVADVDWPLQGRMVDFGRPAEAPVAQDITWRCGTLAFAEAMAVRDSVRATPFVPLGFHSQADLRWRSRGERVTLMLTPVLPEDPPGCPVDLFP